MNRVFCTLKNKFLIKFSNKNKIIWIFFLLFIPFFILFFLSSIIIFVLVANKIIESLLLIVLLQIISWSFNFLFPFSFLFWYLLKRSELLNQKKNNDIKTKVIEKWLNTTFVFPLKNKKNVSEIEKYFLKIPCVYSFCKINDKNEKEINFYRLTLFKIFFYQSFKNYRDLYDRKTRTIIDQISFEELCNKTNLLSKFHIQLIKKNIDSNVFYFYIYLK